MSKNSICALGLGWIGHRKAKVSALIAMCLMLFTGLAYSNTVNPQIEMYLETPAQNETYTGVAFVRGWAVAPSGVEKIELYIDGAYILDVPIGESRTAVGELYPNYPDSDKSGFNMAYFYSKLDAGTHTAAVRAVDRNGQYKDVFADFNVVRFDTNQSNNFIRDPSIVSLNAATVINNNGEISIQGVNVDGAYYNIRIGWNNLLQGLTINSINANQNFQPPTNNESNINLGSFDVLRKVDNNCHGYIFNPHAVEIDITSSENQITIKEDDFINGVCIYTASLTSGSPLTGTFRCANDTFDEGNFTLTEGLYGTSDDILLIMNIANSNRACNYKIKFAGFRMSPSWWW